MSARKYLKSGVFLTGGSLLSAVCSLARNIIVARMISVEDFGIASTFAMTISLIEMASNLALDRMLVQAPDGNAPRMLATAHAFQVFRSLLVTIILFALASPVATLFNIPEVVWAFQLIAFVPLIRGFGHLDAARLQREMRFGGSVWLDTGPQVLTTAIAAPLALWLGDYRVMLVIIIAQVLTMTLVSHLVAERPYRWAWDTMIIQRMLRFGWPLLLNGFVMFAIFQGDKAIVGMAFTMEELGWYSAAFALALMPSLILPKVISTLLFPSLSRAHARGDVARQAIFTIEAFSYSAMLFAIFYWFFGPLIFVAVFGASYAPAADIIALLGLMQAVRVLKTGHITVAFSAGKTQAILWSNATRTIGLALAIASAATGFGLSTIVVCGLIGELVALSVITTYSCRFGIPLRRTAGPAAIAITSTVLFISAYELFAHHYQLESYSALLVKLICFTISCFVLLVFTSLNSELRHAYLLWRSSSLPRMSEKASR